MPAIAPGGVSSAEQTQLGTTAQSINSSPQSQQAQMLSDAFAPLVGSFVVPNDPSFEHAYTKGLLNWASDTASRALAAKLLLATATSCTPGTWYGCLGYWSDNSTVRFTRGSKSYLVGVAAEFNVFDISGGDPGTDPYGNLPDPPGTRVATVSLGATLADLQTQLGSLPSK